jgi:hypothetical protein
LKARAAVLVWAAATVFAAVGATVPGAAATAGVRAPNIPAPGGPSPDVATGTSTATSTNWSGYASTGTTFSGVKGTWTQPASTCPSATRQYAAFWVGIDGYSSDSVEQTGTDSDCDGVNKPSYYAWYEMYPSPSKEITSVPIAPGNVITAKVVSSGTSFTLTLINDTTGKSFTTTKTLSGAAESSAEWIAEAPSSCVASRCRVLPLADFGSVKFTASEARAGGAFAPINSSSWSDTAITMAKGSTTEATPSSLASGGAAFSVAWDHT